WPSPRRTPAATTAVTTAAARAPAAQVAARAAAAARAPAAAQAPAAARVLAAAQALATWPAPLALAWATRATEDCFFGRVRGFRSPGCCCVDTARLGAARWNEDPPRIHLGEQQSGK